MSSLKLNVKIIALYPNSPQYPDVGRYIEKWEFIDIPTSNFDLDNDSIKNSVDLAIRAKNRGFTFFDILKIEVVL